MDLCIAEALFFILYFLDGYIFDIVIRNIMHLEIFRIGIRLLSVSHYAYNIKTRLNKAQF